MSTSGIGRFVSDGRFDLARIIEAHRSEPEAMKALGAERVARLHADRESERRRVEDASRR